MSRSEMTTKTFTKLKNLKFCQNEASAFSLIFLWPCFLINKRLEYLRMHLVIGLLTERTPCEPNRISPVMKSWSYNFSFPPHFSWKIFVSHWQHPSVKCSAVSSQETARRCLLVLRCSGFANVNRQTEYSNMGQ